MGKCFVRPCSIEGCAKNVIALELCSMHYNRLHRHGDPLKRKTAANGDLMEYFRSVVMKYEGDDCTKWPFHKMVKGRAGMLFEGKNTLVARAVCTEVNGSPPTPDHEAAHNCGHLWCVTKNHLRWATHAENENDKTIHGTRLRGEQIGTSRWNEGQIRFIRTSSLSARQISDMLGISQDYVYSIRKRNVWAHLS